MSKKLGGEKQGVIGVRKIKNILEIFVFDNAIHNCQ